MDGKDYHKEYWEDFADAYISPIQSNGLVNRFVTNPAVTGLYAESWIHYIVSKMLPQYRISTGAIINSSDKQLDKLSTIPQCDIIIWDPSELPALFEQGNFALVSNISARAIIEVKRTTNNDNQAQLSKQKDRLLPKYKRNIMCVVVKNSSPLFVKEVAPDWLKEIEDNKAIPETRLFDEHDKVDPDGVFAFIYFLSQVAGHNDRFI